jgi:hypothetical protein
MDKAMSGDRNVRAGVAISSDALAFPNHPAL